MGTKNKTDTLCWLCGHACGGCSWADEFIPVEGWTAEKTSVYGGQESYSVSECPLFVHQERLKELDDGGCMRLIEQMLKVARDDYMRSGERTSEEIERFIRDKDMAKIHMISDPETVIKGLRKQKRLYWTRRTSYMKG